MLWKALLEDVFDYFLLFFFGDEAQKFDFKRGFEFLDKELDQLFPPENNETSRLRFVDKLVKVFTIDGEEKWILVHIEVQGYNDPEFPRRMFTYFYRILDKYNKPVTSVAIFTDSNPAYAPDTYYYNFMGVKNTFTYNTYKVIAQDAAELAKNNNPFALVVLTVLLALQKGKQVEEELIPLKINIARTLLGKAVPAKIISTLMTFLRLHVHFEKPENNIKFEEEISLIANKNKTTMGLEEFVLERAKREGIEQGIEQGIEKGKAIFVERLLNSTDFSDEKIAAIVGVTIEFVRKIKA